MRNIFSAICPKHGYHKGGDCPKCDKEFTQESFMTNKDRLYVFNSTALGIPIESKSQWKRELKERGLTDDFVQGSGRIKEMENATQQKPKFDRELVKSHIRNEMKEKGIYSRDKLFLKEPKRWRIEGCR